MSKFFSSRLDRAINLGRNSRGRQRLAMERERARVTFAYVILPASIHGANCLTHAYFGMIDTINL